jgi:hypothetical protein
MEFAISRAGRLSGTPRSGIGKDTNSIPARPKQFSFALQSDFGNLFPFKKAYDHIKTRGLRRLPLQPIISTRTSGNRYPPGRLYLNPM